jgi:hypothetical protein
MATKKTGTRGETKPFTERFTKRMQVTLKLGEKLAKANPTLSKSLVDVSTEALKWIAKQPIDFRVSGIATAARSWNVGDECRLVEEYAFMFPTLKTNTSYKVLEVKKMGEGRGSKTFLRLDAAGKPFVQGSQVEK